jgi:hypothetical protein
MVRLQDVGKSRQYEIISTEICEMAINYNVESTNATVDKLLKLVDENGIEPYVKWSLKRSCFLKVLSHCFDDMKWRV